MANADAKSRGRRLWLWVIGGLALLAIFSSRVQKPAPRACQKRARRSSPFSHARFASAFCEHVSHTGVEDAGTGRDRTWWGWSARCGCGRPRRFAHAGTPVCYTWLRA
jgi:hypothetical protein